MIYPIEYSSFRDCRPLHDIHGDCLLVPSDTSNLRSGNELHDCSVRWSDDSFADMVLPPEVRRCALVHGTSFER